MANNLSLLQSFVDGEGAGAQTFVTYPENLDSNFASIETTFNVLNAEFKAFGGQDAALVNDLTLTVALTTGFVGVESFASVTFQTGDTQITIPIGTAITGSGRIRTTGSFQFTGSGASGTRWFALSATGVITQETAASQGILDLYSITWGGATFTTATLARLPTTSVDDIIVEADDFQAARIQENFGQGSNSTLPAFTYDTITARLDDVVRIMGADLVSSQAVANSGGNAQAALNPMAFGGAVGTPGFILSDGTTYDTTTGFYRISADVIGVATSGIEALRFDTNQNLSAGSQYRLHVTTTAEALASGTSYVATSMDTEVTDVGGWGAAPTATWTVPSGGGGFYWISGTLTFDESVGANAGTLRDLALEVNGTVALRGKDERAPRGSGTVDNTLSVSMGVELAAAQTVELHARQDSGSSENVDASLSIVRLW